MTTYDLQRCLAALEELPADQTARCLLLAAEQTIHIWQDWARANGLDDLSPAFLECFENWQRGEATTAILGELTEQLYEQFPSDLRTQENPLPGMAGISLTNVGLIATEGGAEISHCLIEGAVTLAAAAHCGIKRDALSRSLDDLTACEWDFIDRWWAKCESWFPELKEKLADPKWKPWWE